MKVILTEDVMGLGDIGETLIVKPGYARNYLVPRGFAIEAGSASARTIEHKMRQVEAKKRRLKGSAETLGKELAELEISLGLRVGKSGKVFGSIGSRDIAAELTAQGYSIDRRRVLLEEPIRKLGTHFVNVKLHPQVKTQVKIMVLERKATQEEEEKEAENAKKAVEEKVALRRAAELSSEDALADDVS